jgi:hypothetical protein
VASDRIRLQERKDRLLDREVAGVARRVDVVMAGHLPRLDEAALRRGTETKHAGAEALQRGAKTEECG